MLLHLIFRLQEKLGSLKANLGPTDLSQKHGVVQTNTISRIVVHPLYNKTGKEEYDIAVIEVGKKYS